MTRNLYWTLFAATALVTAPALAQTYPSKVVRIVTTAPGSGTNIVSRLIAQELSTRMGQQFIVDNRGLVAVEAVARSAPDGYTLLLYTSPLWLMPFMRENVGWDPVKDFAPVTLTHRQPSVLVVHPALPVKNVKALIALAKARPGQLNYGSGSSGAPAHLAAELFKSMARVDIVRIPFKGNGPALSALLAGEMQLTFAVPAAIVAHVKAGKLHALAVSSAEPTPLAPGLPTIAASGLPGYESVALAGLFAPAKTPAAVIAALNREVSQVLAMPEVKERLFNAGVEPVSNTPEAFAATIKADMAKWGKLIKEAGIHE